MGSKHHLGVSDYAIVVLSLFISAMIGIKFRFSGGRQKTTNEFLMAGKNMPKFPVVLSIVVTTISAISMLGSPAEIYRFGIQYATIIVAVDIGMVLATYIVLPVYFQCGVSTIYEFLEMRFGKTTRYTVSVIFILEMVMYMGVCLYGPALAMSAVTDISIETSMVVFAGVCTFYCSIGGLKAVLWTDVFQAALMFSGLIIVYIVAIHEVGGISEVYGRALEGKRLNVFNFSIDLTTRHTFWNVLLQGLVTGIGSYSTNQVQVQRLLSLSTCERAQSAFLWSILPMSTLILLCSSLGIILYAFSTYVIPYLTKLRQLVPFYIVTRFSSIPCVTGLCVAGIFSGSLSSISSAINSLSAVTVTDIIQPIFSSVNFSEKKLVFMAKGLALFYGVICICFAFIISRADSILHITTAVLGTAEGSLCGIFLMAILTTRTSEKNILFGLLIGFISSAWIGFGTMFSGYTNPPLPLNTSLCPPPQNTSISYDSSTAICDNLQNCSTNFSVFENTSNDPFILYKLPFMWVPIIGWTFTMFFAFISSLITDWNGTNEVSVECLSPITRLWNPKVSTNRRNDTRNIEMESRNLTVPNTEDPPI